MQNAGKEKAVAVYLNSRMVINSFEVVCIGGMEFGCLSPKEIFKGALLTNSPNFIVLHNHPSGDPEPSDDDRAVLERIRDQAEIMDIRMVDFIVIGEKGFWSWASRYTARKL